MAIGQYCSTQFRRVCNARKGKFQSSSITFTSTTSVNDPDLLSYGNKKNSYSEEQPMSRQQLGHLFVHLAESKQTSSAA